MREVRRWNAVGFVGAVVKALDTVMAVAVKSCNAFFTDTDMVNGRCLLYKVGVCRNGIWRNMMSRIVLIN